MNIDKRLESGNAPKHLLTQWCNEHVVHTQSQVVISRCQHVPRIERNAPHPIGAPTRGPAAKASQRVDRIGNKPCGVDLTSATFQLYSARAKGQSLPALSRRVLMGLSFEMI